MLEFIRNIAPYIVWLIVMGASIQGFMGNPGRPLIVLIVLVSLPNIYYPAQDLPLGTQFLNLLSSGAFLGMLRLDKAGLKSPKSFIIFSYLFLSYLATWNTSMRFGLPPPISGESPVLADWKNYGMMLCFYFLAFHIPKSSEDVKKYVLILLAVLLFSILQNYKSAAAEGAFSMTRRAAGAFGFVGLNANHFGSFLAHYTAVAMGLFVLDRSRVRRIFYAIIIIGSIYPLFYTYSRGALGAWFVALLAVGSLKKPSWLMAGLLVLAFWQSVLPDNVVERIQMTENTEGALEESAALRLVVWNLAQEFFLDNPLFGIGYNGFYQASEGLRLRNVHNFYLQIAAEMGIIGVGIFMVLMISALRSGIALLKQGRTPFAKGLGLGYISCVSAVLTSNIFGDRFSPLALGSFFFLLMGFVDKMKALDEQQPVDISQNKIEATR